ncbi:MAG TPA: hypothetical protein VFC19_17775 [Candidatus Limnocylindrales bacterium]|nr:hypothetical protein [Candidatus Limnocylindrales bacterium]
MAFGTYGCFATHENYATKSHVEKTPLVPAEPAELSGVDRRLHLYERAGRAVVGRHGPDQPVLPCHLHAMQQDVSIVRAGIPVLMPVELGIGDAGCDAADDDVPDSPTPEP